jgi:hypothetical protein
MTPIPAAPVAESIDQRVIRLLARWREDTAYLSSSTRIAEHAAYQELIGLGQTALPSLFRDLEQTRDGHLSKALTAITGACPVPPDDRGQIKKIAEAWLQWARENGCQW